jgi:hypothetical protein
VIDAGNGTYFATSGFIEGNYDKALNGSIQTLSVFVFARMGQTAEMLSAELAPVIRANAMLAAAKASAAASETATTVSTAVREATQGGCFVAGTQVLTAEGMRPIEEVAVGDQVWAWDENTGAPGWHTVKRAFIRPQKEVLRLELVAADGSVELLGTTAEHPFWVEGQGWTEALKLESGDVLVTAEGRPARVQALFQSASLDTVYNLEVEQAHTYFVGALSVWVHNATCAELFAQAVALRDALVQSVAKMKTKPAVIVGAYSPSLQKAVAAKSLGGGRGCAEAACSQLLDYAADIQFTTPIRPRGGGRIFPVCESCEATFGRLAFPDPATIFKSDVVKNP